MFVFSIIFSYLCLMEMIEYSGYILKRTKTLDITNEKILGRKGELGNYLRSQNRDFTFGMLKNIFEDAIRYKKKREMIKGGYKMFHRIIPLIFAFISFPVWVVGYILGITRAFNKILKPLLKNPENKYNKILIKIIKGIIHITEGEIKYLIGDDWFYDAFVMEDNLLRMLNKKVVRNFSIIFLTKISEKEDNEVVPDHYIENELKKYLNQKYNINPPMELKK